jgi:hypothetical protein
VSTARGPLNRTMPIPLSPEAVAGAMIVSDWSEEDSASGNVDPFNALIAAQAIAHVADGLTARGV